MRPVKISCMEEMNFALLYAKNWNGRKNKKELEGVVAQGLQIIFRVIPIYTPLTLNVFHTNNICSTLWD